MRIEAVIVCREYSDFLAETLPLNLPQLDDVIVVTSHDDKKTQGLCTKHSVQWVPAHFTEKGHTFNKGLAINTGIDHLRGSRNNTEDVWFLHIDADIVLCNDFRRLLEHSQLNKNNIYGADRLNVYGFEAWQKLKPFLARHYQDKWFIDPGFCHNEKAPSTGVKMGARICHADYGWLPVGYMQLWHSSHTNRRYNTRRGAASGTDVMFPMLWPRENRVLLPEIIVFHLDSETVHKMGTNWHGRKSAEFKPHHHGAPASHHKERHPEHHHHHEHTCHHHKHHHCHCHDYDCHHPHHCRGE